jgi:thymidine kinase
MFAGKTSEGQRLIKKETICGRKSLVIKFLEDKRYENYETNNDNDSESKTKLKSDNYIYTHDLIQMKTDFKVKFLRDIPIKNIMEADVIFIDEGHFFADIVEQCELYANKFNKKVIVSALNGDYNREPFPEISRLISKTDHLRWETAKCLICLNEDAPFSKRIISNRTDTILIGGSESYQAACRSCHPR